MRFSLVFVAAIGLCVSACCQQTEVVTSEHCQSVVKSLQTGCKDLPDPATLKRLVLGVNETCGGAVGKKVDKERLRSYVAGIAASAAKGSCSEVMTQNDMFRAFLIDTAK